MERVAKSAWGNLSLTCNVPDRVDFLLKLLNFSHENSVNNMAAPEDCLFLSGTLMLGIYTLLKINVPKKGFSQ